jgi:hypothetical protein
MRGLRRTGTPAVENLASPSWAPVASAMRVRPTRRKVLLGGFCLCCLHGTLRASEAGPFAMEEIAAGIHIRRGFDERATQANENAIANTGFILGRDAVLVTDPGGSRTDGERLRATIA